MREGGVVVVVVIGISYFDVLAFLVPSMFLRFSMPLWVDLGSMFPSMLPP